MKIDLLKTKVTGSWFIEISDIGWAIMKKAITATLFDYVFDAYIRITGESINYREDEHLNWEIIEYSSQKRKLWVRRKWK